MKFDSEDDMDEDEFDTKNDMDFGFRGWSSMLKNDMDMEVEIDELRSFTRN